MTRNKISEWGIALLVTEIGALGPEILENSESPFERTTYCYVNLSKTQNVQGSKSNCVFLDGPAGAGKMFLCLTLYNWCLENQKKNAFWFLRV